MLTISNAKLENLYETLSQPEQPQDKDRISKAKKQHKSKKGEALRWRWIFDKTQNTLSKKFRDEKLVRNESASLIDTLNAVHMVFEKNTFSFKDFWNADNHIHKLDLSYKSLEDKVKQFKTKHNKWYNLCYHLFTKRKLNRVFTLLKKDFDAVKNGINVTNQKHIHPPLAIPKDPSASIKSGYGEYIVYRMTPQGKEIVSKQDFKNIFNLFITRDPDLKERVKQIDPTLEIAFVPRTLYELFFLRQCAEEELSIKEAYCPNLETNRNRASKGTKEDVNHPKTPKNCWHICQFTHAGNDQSPYVRKLAYKLNNLILAKLVKQDFSYADLDNLTNDHIQYFKGIYHSNDSDFRKKININSPGVLTNFSSAGGRGESKSMGIKDESDIKIIKNALALECSEKAQNALIAYRGAVMDDEKLEKDGKPFSLSYGSSLFAGALYDGGATAYHYMWVKLRDAFAIVIPRDQAQDSVIHVPVAHAISQLCASGEFFHGRSKIWKSQPEVKIEGIPYFQGSANWTYGTIPHYLKSSLDKESFFTLFKKITEDAVYLK